LRVYRFHLAAGKTWRFAVDAFAGDPDLYVWNAAGALVGYSNALDLAAETVTVLAAESGVFQVEVHGYRDSRYTLSGQGTAPYASCPADQHTGRTAGAAQRTGGTRPKSLPPGHPALRVSSASRE